MCHAEKFKITDLPLKVWVSDFPSGENHWGQCHVMKMKGMVFRYTWVYSKEDTMAHTRRPMVTS